jgi:glycosyltransferase involved in cell wall biosynthesis
MWILALVKNLNPEQVTSHLAITRESPGQNIELFRRHQKLGLKSHQLKMGGRFDPRVIISLSQLIRKEKIDIIHTHGYKSDLLGLIAARLTRIKAIATPHGFENAPNRKLQAFIRIGCMALRHFDSVAPLSDDLMHDMRRIGVKQEQTQLIINGVDLDEVERERNAQRPPLYGNTQEKRIGYVGQLSHRKNVGDLIRAFDSLYSTFKQVRLLIIGDGPDRTRLIEISKSLPASDNVEFLGYRDDRLRLVKELDVFSMTSSLEGIPRGMMEAMGLGVPVAAYDIPGVNKLLIHGETGLLAPPGDIEALKRCWERILLDRDFAKTLGANGRRYIVEQFSAKRMAQEYTQLYSRLARRNEV